MNHKTINAKLLRAAPDDALFWRGIDGAPCRFRCPRTRHRTYKRACIIPHDLLINQGAVQDFLPPGRMAALARHCGLQPCTNLNFGPSPALSSAPLSPIGCPWQAISIAERTDITDSYFHVRGSGRMVWRRPGGEKSRSGRIILLYRPIWP